MRLKRRHLNGNVSFLKSKADFDMKFESFIEIYVSDLKQRLRENTFITKENIIYKKILPFFKEKKMNTITPKDVIKWQNEIMAYCDKNGKGYSPTYLKTIHNQLSAIFNHAVRNYDLKSNPAAKAGNMGEKDGARIWSESVSKPMYNQEVFASNTNGSVNFRKPHKTLIRKFQFSDGMDISNPIFRDIHITICSMPIFKILALKSVVFMRFPKFYLSLKCGRIILLKCR